MNLYRSDQIIDAYRNARAGGQSLYLCRKRTGEIQTAWLIDPHIERLMATARNLGMRRVRVWRPRQEGQFIVLTGHVLEKAKAECQQGQLI